MTDAERQKDEIEVLSNIFDQNEFIYKKDSSIKGCCYVFPTICNNALELTYRNSTEELTSDLSERKYIIDYLPPVRLYFEFPDNYPSKLPPKFYLVISWLPPWETSFVCQKLDEIWQENEGSEILFLWLEFLKNDLLDFLSVQNSLDVSFLYTVYVSPQEYLKSTLCLMSDSRAANYALFLNPIQFLTNYSKDQHKVEFEKNFYTCGICFTTNNGHKSVEFENCGHIYCIECVQQYITVKITTRNIKTLLCPDLNCNFEITPNEVKNLCPELFPLYDEILLQVTLSTMNDLVFCPRTSCQSPIISDTDDTLAICVKCNYSFCIYCRKVYHGIEPCNMSSNDKMKLVNDYQNGDRRYKQMLEQKYGRRQIQIIVDKYLTDEYLKTNTKTCPKCQTLTTKIDGCNKMICTCCNASFCWLCGMQITTPNGYDHFMTKDSTCYGLLFMGLDDGDIGNLNNIDIEENILWFNEQQVDIIGP